MEEGGAVVVVAMVGVVEEVCHKEREISSASLVSIIMTMNLTFVDDVVAHNRDVVDTDVEQQQQQQVVDEQHVLVMPQQVGDRLAGHNSLDTENSHN